MIAYRVMDDAISVAAQGIGPPIQMMEIQKPERPGRAGRTRRLDDSELRMIADEVSVWKGIESEALSRCVGLNLPRAEGRSQDGAE